MADLKVHLIRYRLGGMDVTDVTKPTDKPVEFFEEDARQRHPNAQMKPSVTYTPEEYAAADERAEELGYIGVGDMLNHRDVAAGQPN